jgi:nuclear transport factor 2 (NTF2) superfamily protein
MRKGSADTSAQERFERHRALAEGYLAAWNTHDVVRVLDCYTHDVAYRDPNTRGEVRGREALGRYLRKLFDRWEMHWSVRELFPLEGVDGSAALWNATFKPRGGAHMVTVEGMDLVVLRGDLMERDEVSFDRAALAPLVQA